MSGMIILQGDEDGKKTFIKEVEKKDKIFRFKIGEVSKWKNIEFEYFDVDLSKGFFRDYHLVLDNVDCENIKFLQDYHPFYIVKVNYLGGKVDNNYKDGKFILGCKSDSFESDVCEVLRLISI